MEALGRLVGDEDFAAGYWGERPLLRRAGSGFSDLLDLEACDELLTDRGLRTPFLRLAKDGTLITDFTGSGGRGAEVADQVRDDLVLKHLAGGATLVFQGLHRIWPPLREFCGLLAGELGCAVQANAYLTPAGNAGFGTHYDTHDVFVLQVVGHKRWRIHRPVQADPLPQLAWGAVADEVVAAAEGEPVIDRILRPGDVLYLPRGWLHAASAQETTSLHLTLGLHRPSIYTVVETLTQMAMSDPRLRRGLPLGVDLTDPEQLAPVLKHAIASFVEHLEQADPQDVARRLRRSQWSATRPQTVRPIATVLHELGPRSLVRLRRGLRHQIEVAEGKVRIALADKTIELPDEGEPDVRELLGGAAVEVGDRLVLARRLVREGVLVLLANGRS